MNRPIKKITLLIIHILPAKKVVSDMSRSIIIKLKVVQFVRKGSSEISEVPRNVCI